MSLLFFLFLLIVFLTLIQFLFSINFYLLFDIQKNSTLFKFNMFITTYVHELMHFITAKIFHFKVKDFKVITFEQMNELDSYEHLESSGSVDIEPPEKIDGTNYFDFIDMINTFFIATAPFILSYLVFLLYLPNNFMKDLNHLDLDLDTVKQVIIQLFQETSFLSLTILIFLSITFLVNTSSLSMQDISVLLSFKTITIIFFAVITVLSSILTSFFNVFDCFSVTTILTSVFVLLLVFKSATALKINVLKYSAFFLLMLIFSTMFKSILISFSIFVLFYTTMLVLSILILLIVKTLFKSKDFTNLDENTDFLED